MAAPPPPPAHPPARVSYDPGWNDPPKLGYSPQSGQSKPRNLLNKRVAFPLSGNTTTTPSAIPPSLHSMPGATLQQSQPIASMALPQYVQEILELDIDSGNALKEVLETFNTILEGSPELGAKTVDIKKRIAIMEEMWTGDKLNTAIQARMRLLAVALKEERPSDADFQHKALMVEHVGSVSQWMTGIRQLVNHCIVRHDLLTIDNDE